MLVLDIAASFVLLLSLTAKADAMTFEVVELGGEPAIIGVGEIVDGDAQRLGEVLTNRARHSAGYFALALNSSGGSVSAAFEIAKVMDAHRVNTYVPPSFECVSACAAIVFIAGREHVVVPSGRLGFHGCYDSQTKQTIGLCNEAIAEHALAHGTAYGSVMAFIQEVPYDQVIWMDAGLVDCWGVSKYEISPEPASFNQCVVDAIRGRSRP